MSRVVVTGGAGFIGSHLTDGLVACGHEVMVIDSLRTGRRNQVNRDAAFQQLDVLDPALASAFSSFQPEVVYHLAAQISVSSSLEDPIQDASINVLGTISVLDACRMAGARKCVLASTAAVYGVPEKKRVTEEDAVRPQSFYGVSKHSAELYLETYSRLYGLDFSALRYSNVYGGRQDNRGEGGVVSIFASSLLAGEQPVIYGSGEQTRDFIYVRDVVAANLAAMDKGSGMIMNVSTDTSVSVNGLLKEMCLLTGTPFEPKYQPARPGDILDSRLDNGMAVQHLDWIPEYSLRDGLGETVAYYREECPASKTG